MSLECGECERDLRGPHAPACTRYVSTEEQLIEAEQAWENWRLRALRAEKAIAAARKILRDDLRRFTSGQRPASRGAYDALDWGRR